MRFRSSSILLAIAATVALACTSPTLPLPPPEAPTETAGATPGTYVLSGTSAIRGAFLIVYNPHAPAGTNQINGTLVGNDGTWTVTITANKGDVVQIWQDSGGDESTAIQFTIL